MVRVPWGRAGDRVTRMMTNRRRWAAVLMLPLILVLSSCVRLNMDVKVLDDKNAEVSMNIGVQKEAATGAGLTGDKLCQQDSTSGFKDNVKTEPYDDGTFVGCKITGKGPVDDTNSMLKLADGVWTFHMPGPSEADTQGAGQMTAAMFTDFKITATFPGEVLTHSGSSTVSGTTVTWTNAADLLSTDGLKATAKNAGGGALLWIILAVAALVVIGAVVFFVLNNNKKKSQAAAAAQPFQGPAQGYPQQPQGYPQAPNQSQGYPPAQGYPQAPNQAQGYPPAQGNPPQGYPPAPPASPQS